MSKDGIASLSRFKIDRIHYSMFDVGRSMLSVRCSTFISFFSDQTGRFLAGGWADT